MTAAKAKPGYDASSIKVLSSLDAIRFRPGMYIGSKSSRGLSHLLWEVLDNSVDEALAGHGSRIDVTLHADGSIEVADEARGIPVDRHASGESALLTLLTNTHAGGKFASGGDAAYESSAGLNGVGLTAVTALTKRLDVTVWRGGKEWRLCLGAGRPGRFAGPTPESKFTAGGDVEAVGKAPKGKTGTSIRYWVDMQWFDDDAVFDFDTLVTKLRNTAFLVPGLKLVLHDARDGKIETTEFEYPDGLVGMVDYYAPGGEQPVSETLIINGSGVYKENAHGSVLERTCRVEVALRWGTGYEYRVNAFTNGLVNGDGGSHVTGLENAITKTVIDAVETTRGLLKPKEQPPTGADVLEGVTAVVHVRVPEPQFTSQTKDKLSTRAVIKVVEQVVSQQLKAWLNDRKSKAQARVVLEKVVNAARVRLEETQQKERARKRNAAEGSSGLPAKLADCANPGDPRSELFIVEGDSAGGSAKKGRSAKYQAILPLRGKPLNVHDLTMDKAMANAEVDAISIALGAGVGRSFDLSRLRYSRVMMMADADDDGSHIRCLLIVLFAKYMRPLIEDGRLYAAVPPLFVVTTTGRNPERLLCFTKADLERTLTGLQKAGKSWKTPIERNKGLGEMNAEELWDTTMNPATRTVRRITMDDVAAAEHLLDSLMGSKAEARKAFLTEYALTVEEEDLAL